MPRKPKPPRLWLRKSAGRSPVWIIKDRGRHIWTGASEADREGAERALEEYLAGKRAAPSGPRGAAALTVADVLAIYATQHGPSLAARGTLSYSIEALAPFWAELTIDQVKGETCRLYAKQRNRAPGTVRRELGVLQAAINHAYAEGYLTEPRKVTLPERPPSRDRWLTREEADALMSAASDHLRRFIVLGLRTGTRKRALLNLRWMPHVDGGHIDLDEGILYRRNPQARETNKRQPPVRLAGDLIEDLRAWRDDGASHVIHFRGKPVADIKTGFAAAVRRSGIEHCHPHILRHTAISWAMQGGATVEEAARYFGVDVKVIQETYWHHSPEFGRGVLDAMERK